jgi:hypothetical protein
MEDQRSRLRLDRPTELTDLLLEYAASETTAGIAESAL